MTDEISTSTIIRPELIDIATEFLKNPKIIDESIEKKRKFLQKKGLTDIEINHAFKLTPEQEIPKQIISNSRLSFFRRFLNDLMFSGLLVLTIKIIKQLFHSDQTNIKIELNQTIKNLEKSIKDMQLSIVKLKQTADQLNLTIQTSKSNKSSLLSIEDIKQEIQLLKGLFRNRSQAPQTPLYQSKTSDKIETNQITTDNDSDGIIVISEQDKENIDDN